jgi:hypothetical protein
VRGDRGVRWRLAQGSGIPVTMIAWCPREAVYVVSSSSMHPILHCARPGGGLGCEAATAAKMLASSGWGCPPERRTGLPNSARSDRVRRERDVHQTGDRPAGPQGAGGQARLRLSRRTSRRVAPASGRARSWRTRRRNAPALRLETRIDANTDRWDGRAERV